MLLGIALALTLALSLLPTSLVSAAVEDDYGQYAQTVIKALNDMAPRTANTDGELKAATYVVGEAVKMGYSVKVIPFTYSSTRKSQNVIVTKKGLSDRVIVVSAHYDCVTAGKGADDNASGVGVTLETMKRLFSAQTPYTIEFLICGAEEAGLQGSKAYVNSLTAEQKANIVCDINLDSLIGGDFMYIYGGSNGRKSSTTGTAVTRRWVYDQAAAIVSELGLDVRSNPGIDRGLNASGRAYSYYPFPTTGTWSDHDPFDQAGIPFLYLEAVNWEIPPYDGSGQTTLLGEVMHTKYDKVDEIENYFPGRIQLHTKTFVKLLEAVLLKVSEPASPAWEDSNYSALKAWSGLTPACTLAGDVITVDFGAPVKTYASAPRMDNFKVTDASGAVVPVTGMTIDEEGGKIALTIQKGELPTGKYTLKFTKYFSLIVKDGTTEYAGSFTSDLRIADAPLITSVTATGTIVSGYPANIAVDVQGEGLEGKALTATVFGVTVPFVGNKATIAVPKADIPAVTKATAYDITVSIPGVSGDVKAKVTVEPLPAGLWSPAMSVNADGNLVITFAADFELKSDAGAVKVNGAAATFAKSGRAITAELKPQSGDKIVITGVRFPKLFPSYSFTFTHTYGA